MIKHGLTFAAVLLIISGCQTATKPADTIETEEPVFVQVESYRDFEVIEPDQVAVIDDEGEVAGTHDQVSESLEKTWVVRTQSDLESTVREWAQREGYAVYVETDRKVLFHNSVDVNVPANDFVSALDVLFRSISLPASGIHYAVYTDSKTLRIFSRGTSHD
ncbi:MAG: TcpQ domain-containing protein [Methyloprofundus sp.]|nr:TcpQ domain-containing protein [Methyloprofundus sp.]